MSVAVVQSVVTLLLVTNIIPPPATPVTTENHPPVDRWPFSLGVDADLVPRLVNNPNNNRRL